jgi:uncharacterized glyoxalase superfamily protein PhnB
MTQASLDGLTLHVRDVERSVEFRDRPWGERTFDVVDPDGHRLEFQEA